MSVVLAARIGGLDVIDGVYNAVHDHDGFIAECRQARECGFDGKSLIHPNQVLATNAAFSPDEREVAHARAIVAAFERTENDRSAAIVVDGRMVELLHRDMARRTIELHQRITAPLYGARSLAKIEQPQIVRDPSQD
jgi:citrate lyase subunit beta/citryl-CoA lyase